MKVWFKGVYISRTCFPDVFSMCLATVRHPTQRGIRHLGHIPTTEQVPDQFILVLCPQNVKTEHAVRIRSNKLL